MFRADITKRRSLAFFRMMETEAAFVHDTSGFRVAVIVAAPDGGHSQILETSPQQTAHGLGYQPLSPIGFPYPITNLGFARLHLGAVQAISEHNAHTANRFIGFFQHYRISFRC